ncbi:MAG: aldose 1-epimerase family protein [Algibacter sp.]|uniref:aldose 1-epimerase family protein n=1 Tax=Algibacter sp. TaxID=1872428 RepID=UPI00262B9BBF|nr:aldose 1-epimerase family protein [Algibacter sp.]MDG1728351.1 aldose 1-epimerase family protein [Algibacter sp.]MDG2178368.1 aldose 1-epimerase family protein [Algibacter sp.]
MYTLKNDKLEIAIKKIGAELCKIASIKNKTDFMWHADPEVWSSYAPNLFPIIGALKDNTYVFENTHYELPKHGFVRHNEAITLYAQTENSLTFKLIANDSLLKNYPFQFEFLITYTLIDNTLEVKHTIKNKDNKTMYFSLGGHPAFKCPVYKNEDYEDYCLEFEHPEHSKRHFINMQNGLISSKTKTVFNNTNKLLLTHDLFNEDALIFKDLKSKKVTLKSSINGEILSVSYPGFPYLGIWAKPNGNYVCIEPWLGIADNETTNQNLKEKEGILSLDANKTFEAAYKIEIHNNHLV